MGVALKKHQPSLELSGPKTFAPRPGEPGTGIEPRPLPSKSASISLPPEGLER